MISKRYRRPARPQENVRQFSLNNSKGVDSTKSPTDFNTVYSAKNLIVNPDGSMSLRKPITFVNDVSWEYRFTKVHYLYNENYRLCRRDGYGFTICDASGRIQDFILKYTDTYKDIVSFSGQSAKEMLYDAVLLHDTDYTVTNLNTSTILGGCVINPSKLPNFIDPELYDTEVSLELPRYIRLHKPSDSDWIVEIVQPEINSISQTENGIPFNPNTTLDNPTALRDGYAMSVPNVKGILAYTYTEESGAGIVPTYLQEPDTAFEGSTSSKVNLAVEPTATSGACTSDTCTVQHLAYDGTLLNSLTFTLTNCTSAAGSNTLKYTSTVSIQLQNTESDTAVYEFNLSLKYHFARRDFYFCETSDNLLKGVSFDVGVELDKDTPVTSTELDGTVVRKEVLNHVRVADITESVKAKRHRITTKFKNTTNTPDTVLKAICNLPKSLANQAFKSYYYCAWFESYDGISWQPVDNCIGLGITVRELDSTYRVNPELDGDATPTYAAYRNVRYYPMLADSEKDLAYISTQYEDPALNVCNVSVRPDVLSAPWISFLRKRYRFKIITVEPLSKGDVELPDLESPTGYYRITSTVSQAEYAPTVGADFEFFNIELGNSVMGKKLYHKKALYSYGYQKFLNNIFVSDIDSFITPLYNIIDLDATRAAQATCVIPWRDYLVSATENSMYLHSPLEDGFLTKTVNTSVGIPEADSRCCKAILNGILFKSGSKVYQLYPNVYAGDDSMLNLTDISKQVEDVLEAYKYGKYPPFAFSTESEYILMLPHTPPTEDGSYPDSTTCLRYDYTLKLWTVCTYPILAVDYRIVSFNDIRIIGLVKHGTAEFKFDSDAVSDTYGDALPAGLLEESSQDPYVIVPIDFEWDTGQKTDSISVTKQFVESKLMFATEDNLEAFPMELTVHVDGDPHITTLDLNSDAPFWKEDGVRSLGVTNTAFRLGNDTGSKLLRQLIVRYSGKGRSVRHILKGSPTSNFRLYETYVRYKTLNVKR